jgi:hypothetical protein
VDNSVPDRPAVEDFEAKDRERLARVVMPVFAAEGLQMEVSGGTSGDDVPVTSLSLTHYGDEHGNYGLEVYVNSKASANGPATDADDDLAYRLGDDANSVQSTSRKLRVDGVERRFAFAAAKDRWAAIGHVNGVTITVEARGIDPSQLHLRALADPTQAMDPAPLYRALRLQLDVLDPRRVTELVGSTSLRDSGKRLAGVAQPAIALLQSKQRKLSWIGGAPRMATDLRWPTGTHGPMTFIAQLAAGDLDPAVWTGPRSGHLHVFCDVDPESLSPDEAPGTCVVLHSPADAKLRVHRFPEALDEATQLYQQMVAPSVGLTLPDAWKSTMDRLGIPIDGTDEFETLGGVKQRLETEQGWFEPAGQIMGWGTWPNDDYMSHLASLGNAEDEEWTLLLQTDALDTNLYIAIPTADLAAGRFDRVQAMVA